MQTAPPTLEPTSTPKPPTATATASPTPTVTATPSPTPTATASPTPTVASFSLQAYTNGLWLEQQDPQLASSIKKLDWIQDGTDDTESEAIQDLLYIAVTSRSVVASIVSLSWVQDGIHDVEAGAFRWLNNIGSAEVSSSVVSLGWVEDGIDAVEVEALENFSYIANKDTGVGLSIITLGWIQDGIADLEAGAIDWLNNIASPEVALSVVSLGWMQDGIDAVEVEALENLSYMSNKDTGVGLSVVSLGWIQDGITETEVDAVRYLGYIANDNTVASERISKMPFLTAIEPVDVSALDALSDLAGYAEDAFDLVMAHPSLAVGITDAITPVVATLYGVAKTNPNLVDTLLDPDNVNLERRSATLPLTGEVDLAIVRTRPGAARSMDLLEHSVRAAEELMGKPLPTRYVGLLYEDAASGGFAGTNFGTHIAILPKYDVDDGSHEAEIGPHAIAHEVAHYYWSGNANWIDEGIADFMASTIENRRTKKPVGVTNGPCIYAQTIAELEVLAPDPDTDDEFGCNYSLGERLYVDMSRAIGEDAIWRGLRDLYAMSLVEDDADDLKGTAVNLEHLREAFQSAPGAAVSLARWYDGTEDYDLSQLDTGPVDPTLPSISGHIDEAYIATFTDGPAVSGFSTQEVSDWVYLTLKYSYNVSEGPHEVPLEIVEFYEDGFEFSRRSGEFTAEARYIGGTAWFSVGTSPSQQWAPGRYWVYVYEGERKVAEVQYEVTP